MNDYAKELDAAVKAGIISPATAEKLLAQYKTQGAQAIRANTPLASLIAGGGEGAKLAQRLLGLQAKNASAEDYAKELDAAVKAGTISPATAEKLLTQYKMQGKQAVMPGSPMAELLASGGEGAQLAQRLLGLQAKNASVDDYAKELDAAVKAGIISPATAEKLLAQYKTQGLGTQAIRANTPLAGLIAGGGEGAKLAQRLLGLQAKNASVEDYTKELEAAVKAGTISPATAEKLLTQYKMQGKQAVIPGSPMAELLASGGKGAQLAQRLLGLQAKNASEDDYAKELDAAVKAGTISPETAAKLLTQYKMQGAQAGGESGPIAALLGSGGEGAKLGKRLQDMQANNASVNDYANELNAAVEAGLISPAAAKKLLTQYEMQNAQTGEASSPMAELLASGGEGAKLAQRLQDMQANNASVDDYANELNAAVEAGLISPATAEKLLAQYKMESAQAGGASGPMAELLARGGEGAKLAQRLLDMQANNASVDDYTKELNAAVKAGTITPATAEKLLAQYKNKSTQPSGATGAMAELLASGGEGAKLAQRLLDMQANNASVDDYTKALDAAVKAGTISPATAERLLTQYKTEGAQTGRVADPMAELIASGDEGLKEAQRLLDMQTNNASIEDYTNELKRAVKAGIITPELAARLLQQYQAQLSPTTTYTGGNAIPTIEQNIPGAAEFSKLQQRVGQPAVVAPTPVNNKEEAAFEQVAAQANLEAEQARQDRINKLIANMQGQASKIIDTAWVTPTMINRTASPPEKKNLSGTGTPPTAQKSESGAANNPLGFESGPTTPPMIKAGTIYFAVLDTGVDSDFPDTPVMATIVQGPFKGAKLLGKLTLVPGKDRISLNFTLMDKEDWLETKPINAFAIDPDTARTAIASDVNHHYLTRYGALFGASFLAGYSNAIMTSRINQYTDIFGITTTLTLQRR